MQKIRISILYGLIVTAAAVMFFCTFLQVRAGYITGSEAGFTHTHQNSCYKEVSETCEGRHTVYKINESGIYYCTTCADGTDHLVLADMYNCPVLGASWQRNGIITCKTCGTVHSTWSQDAPEVRITKSRTLNCSIGEGETTATLTISADDTWTNSGVMLTANLNEIKHDLTIGNVDYSWEDGKLYVTENGTYFVTAANAAGRSITAAIEISCIDKTPPVILGVNANTNEMTKNAIYISVNAADNESGLDEQAYSLDGGLSWSASSGFLLEEGKDIQLAVRDKAGNIVTQHLKRNAFPYPPEPSPSVKPSAPSSDPASSSSSSAGTSGASSGEASSASEGESPDNERSDAVSLGKGSQAASDSTEKDGADGSLQVSDRNTSSSRRSGLPVTDENTDSAEEDFFSGNEDGTDSLTSTDMADELQIAEADGQVRESVMVSGEGTVLGAETAIPIAKGGTSERIKASGDIDRTGGFLSIMGAYIQTHLRSLLGAGLLTAGAGMLFRLIWLHSAVLYCYNGGEEYRRIGLFHLRRKKQEFELYLPEYMLETRGTPRYRLMFKSKLVKKYGGEDLVVHGEDYKLRQPLEECVDFVL